MEAKEKSLIEIFGSGPQKLIVPFFQRRYVWDEENWDELIKTIEDNDDIKVFLGSVIIKWGEHREPSEATIVDGQQRLTTISILTKAIYDEFDDATKENVKSILQSVLFYKKNTTDPVEKSEIKIEHSRVDREDYNIIIRKGVFDGTNVDVEEIKSNCTGQIGRCYLYYRNLLHKKSQEEISKIFNTMYNDANKMLVRIVLQENDVNEQSIFDTINRAGSRLSTADIIKNNLFKGFIESCNNEADLLEEVYQIYDKKWDELFYSPTGESVWDLERRFGNVGRNNLEFLLYCVACIRWAKEGTSDFFNKLEIVYSRELQNYTFQDYKNLIDDINSYALIFRDRICKLSEIMHDKTKCAHEYFSYCEHIKRLLLTLEVFGVQMFYPFVLKILKDANCEFENPELIRKAKILETFVVRRRIIGSSVSDYAVKCNLILNRGVEELFVRTGDKEISIGDAEIKSKLVKVNDETAKMILFWIELSRKNKDSDIDGLTYTYTIEHIMPHKWENNWNVPNEQSEKRRVHIPDLGNLTLLKNSLNSKVANSDFKTKIEGLPAEGRKKPREGYRGNISLAITEEIVKYYDDGNEVWNEEAIDERRNRLTEEILELWPII